MAKSISRYTGEYLLTNGQTVQTTKSELDISDGWRYNDYSKEEQELIQCCMERYREIAPHIYIHEGEDNLTTDEIAEKVKKHIMNKGKKPVVAIDYLQLLGAPKGGERLDDKQIVDKNVMALKRIARDYKVPIIVISSFSRAKYNEKVSLSSFKESGKIEYTADVAIGLQLKGVGQPGFDADAAKVKDERDVQAVVVKNRKGEMGSVIDFSYYPKCNLFEEKKNG